MLLIGKILYGFCEGYFGRDGYGDKRIEGLGDNWIVARNIESGQIHFAEGENIHEKLNRYTIPEEE